VSDSNEVITIPVQEKAQHVGHAGRVDALNNQVSLISAVDTRHPE
jgi:hypothetical protein